MGKLNNLVTVGGGLATLGAGVGMLAKSVISEQIIMNAVYEHADKITPEIIQQAKDLSNVGMPEFGVGIFGLAVSGFCLGNYIDSYRKKI